MEFPFYFFDAVQAGRQDVQAGGKPGALVRKAYGSKVVRRYKNQTYHDAGNHFQNTGKYGSAGKSQSLYAETADIQNAQTPEE